MTGGAPRESVDEERMKDYPSRMSLDNHLDDAAIAGDGAAADSVSGAPSFPDATGRPRSSAVSKVPLALGLVILAAIIGWTALTTVRASQADAGSSAAKIGRRAPEISLRLLENGKSGRVVTLSELQGKPVLLNFWATWCSPCRDEFPTLEAKYRQYKDSKGLVVVGVDSSGDSGASNTQRFINQVGATFPIWLAQDPGAEDRYRVDALPTTFFIDRNGIIQDMIVGGPMQPEYIDKELSKIF